MAEPISPICRQNILVLARAYVKRRKPQLKLSTISSLCHGDPNAIDKLALKLANYLLKECCQRSCTVMTPSKSHYIENEGLIIPR